MRYLLAILLAMSSGLGAVDPNFSSVQLLVPFEGDDAATSATDQSNNGATPTFVGNAQLDTAEAPTGQSSSLLLDGTGDYVTIPDAAWMDLGDSDFTIEWWWNWNTDKTTAILGRTTSLPAGSWSLIYNTSTNQLRFFNNSTVNICDRAYTPAASWEAMALVRNGDTWTWYADGSRIVSDCTNSATIVAGAQDLYIGSFTGGDFTFDGWIGPVRITVGVARYSGASYTVPTLPLPVATTQPIRIGPSLNLDRGVSYHYEGEAKVVTFNPLGWLATPLEASVIRPKDDYEVETAKKVNAKNAVKKTLKERIKKGEITVTPTPQVKVATPTPTATTTPNKGFRLGF